VIFAERAIRFVHELDGYRMATMRLNLISPAIMGIGELRIWMEQSAFPLLICVILLQNEVRQLWAKPGKGFEIIPLATAVPTSASVPAAQPSTVDIAQREQES
jgi:hypothetical protein